MRLLTQDEGGKIRLEPPRNSNSELPKYAILSHTWLDDHLEPTFQDLEVGRGEHKHGYEKLRFCAAQARKDGLEYFWIDTVCINKFIETELNTAINSMHRWYQQAAKCYVYLSDVEVPDDVDEPHIYPITWASAFAMSRWFKRGWTLQELIAPRFLEFFSKNGKSLGTKISLEKRIQQITEIPINVLREGLVHGCSVDSLFTLVHSRNTTKEEDKVYCLLGMFGISMKVRYGEGFKNAKIRLEKKFDIKQKWEWAQQQKQTLLSRELTSEPVNAIHITRQPGNLLGPGTETECLLLDDALHPNSYPLLPEFYSSPQQFADFMQFFWSKRSKNYPGSFQISNGHYEVFNAKNNVRLGASNWSNWAKPGGHIKLSFRMGRWHGLPLNHCIRCGKPGKMKKRSKNFQSCGSCILEVREASPAEYSDPRTELQDIQIGEAGPREFLDLRKRGLLRPSEAWKHANQTHGGNSGECSNPDAFKSVLGEASTPSIDFVCRRLSITWEPLCNIVCRYAWCRCIIWRSTPNSMNEFYQPEMTVLYTICICPRHNNEGVYFPDYGDCQYQQDPYFEKFGGYDSFRHGIRLLWPAGFLKMGGEKFVSAEEATQFQCRKHSNNPFDDLMINCTKGRTQHTIESLTAAVADYKRENLERFYSERDCLEKDDPRVEKNQARQTSTLPDEAQYVIRASDFPHNKGVYEVLLEKWSGIPHWEVEE